MKMKNSVNRLVVSILVLGALLLSAFTVRAAAGKIAPAASSQGPISTLSFERIGAAFAKVLHQEESSASQVKDTSQDQSGQDEDSQDDQSIENQHEMESEHEITGAVTAVSSNSWTVGNTVVMIDMFTEIDAGLGLGALVKAEGQLRSDGSFLAREIESFDQNSDEDESGEDDLEDGEHSGSVSDDEQEVETEDDHANQTAGAIEFTGKLTAMNGGAWTINGMTVMISASTEIKGSPQIGSLVKVEGMVATGGSIQARQVKVTTLDQNHDDDHRGSGGGSGSDDHDDDRSGSGDD